MEAHCEQCGRAFTAKTRRAKYCSGACKKRTADKRKRMGQVIPLRSGTGRRRDRVDEPPDDPGPDDSPEDDGPLVASLRAAFKDDDLATPAGVIALRLSRDVDRMVPGLPGYAAIVKQLRDAVNELRTQAKPKVATPLTLLRERRAADRSADTG